MKKVSRNFCSKDIFISLSQTQCVAHTVAEPSRTSQHVGRQPTPRTHAMLKRSISRAASTPPIVRLMCVLRSQQATLRHLVIHSGTRLWILNLMRYFRITPSDWYCIISE